MSYSLIILVAVSVVSCGFFSKSIPEIVYVDNVVLFHEFNMSMELREDYREKIDLEAKKVDSLIMCYKTIQVKKVKEKLDDEKLETFKSQIQIHDKSLQKLQDYFSNEVTQQVWDRLNTYTKEYGASQGYKIVLGAQGNGNVMYSDGDLNVTKEILEYANSQYEGL